MQPCNGSGPITPESVKQYAIVSVDWSSQKNLWVQGRPMDASTPLVEQAALLSRANPGQKVWLYMNAVIAYPWFPLIRKKMLDPAYSEWFLKFGPSPFSNGSFHVPQCDTNWSPPLCTDFYHSQDQTP